MSFKNALNAKNDIFNDYYTGINGENKNNVNFFVLIKQKAGECA